MAPTLLPEVFSLIFSHFQKADLKPLRLVGRMFNELIIPFLFDKIYISPQYLNLAVFRNISRSPHLAKHVKELVYDATHFDHSMDRQRYEFSMISGITNWWIPPGHVPDSDYHIYRQLAMDQETLIKSEQDFVHLSTGLRLMPNIKSVVVMDYWDDEYGDGSGPLCGVAGPLSRMCNPSILRPQWTGDSGQNPSPAIRIRSQHIFLALIRSFSTGSHKIQMLGYRAQARRVGWPLHILDLAQTDLQHTINMFQHLRRISLPLCTYEDKALGESLFRAGNVARIFSAAVNLDRLELRFDSCGAGCPLYPFTLLFGESTTWLRLEYFALAALLADPKDLMEFFYRHRGSLKHVELTFVGIEGEQWEEVYHSMQKCLHLESFGTNERTYFEMLESGALNLGKLVGTGRSGPNLLDQRPNKINGVTGHLRSYRTPSDRCFSGGRDVLGTDFD